MIWYILRRLLYMLVTLALVSVVAFLIIQLPPGNYIDTYIRQLETTGQAVTMDQIEILEKQYGLDRPMYIQYFKWARNILRGDFGRSFQWWRPVSELIGERILLTITLSLVTLVFTYIVAIPIGIFSATHQYSIGDYFFTVLGFSGLAVPNFLLALILMYIFFQYFGMSVGGLFSAKYGAAPWSFGKLVDLIKHLPIPIIVVGTAGTAGLIRVMRGCLLDELRKQYIITARAKGVKERTLLFKYPVRVAINPVISNMGWLLPQIVSGATITAVVLNLPTVGPLLLKALQAQDMFLAASMIMFLTFLTVIGVLISDLLLVWIDPRIRFEKSGG
jgi:peptide/nickel transport system permease protein